MLPQAATKAGSHQSSHPRRTPCALGKPLQRQGLAVGKQQNAARWAARLSMTDDG